MPQDFSGQNLRGRSFKGQDLAGANFSYANIRGADFSEANLRGVNFSNVEAGLQKRWVIGIVLISCLLSGISGNFSGYAGSFISILLTNGSANIDPRAIAISFKQLAENHPEVDLRIVGMEVRGENKFLLRAKTAAMADKSELSAEYFEIYNQLKTLAQQELQALISEKDTRIRSLETMVVTALQSPKFYAQTYSNQGDTMPQSSKKQSNFNLQGAQFAGGLVNADTVNAHQIGGNITNYNPEQKQNLAEAASQIQQLLNQLGQTYPTNTPLEKQIAVTEALKQIDNNPTLKARVIGALKAGGTEAFKELVDHPLVNILLATLEGWQDAE